MNKPINNKEIKDVIISDYKITSDEGCETTSNKVNDIINDLSKGKIKTKKDIKKAMRDVVNEINKISGNNVVSDTDTNNISISQINTDKKQIEDEIANILDSIDNTLNELFTINIKMSKDIKSANKEIEELSKKRDVLKDIVNELEYDVCKHKSKISTLNLIIEQECL